MGVARGFFLSVALGLRLRVGCRPVAKDIFLDLGFFGVLE